MRVESVYHGTFQHGKYFSEDVICVEFGAVSAYGGSNEREKGSEVANKISAISNAGGGKLKRILLSGNDPVCWQHDTELLNLLGYLKKNLYEVCLETKGNIMLSEHMKSFLDYVYIFPDYFRRDSFYERSVFHSYEDVPHCFNFVFQDEDDISKAMEFASDFLLKEEELYFLVPKRAHADKKMRQQIIEKAQELFKSARIGKVETIEL